MKTKLLRKLRKLYEWKWDGTEWEILNKKTGKTHWYTEACLFVYEDITETIGFYTFLKQYEKMIKRGRVKYRLF